MTVAEVMAEIEVNPNFVGQGMTDDFVLAINTGEAGADVSTFSVCQDHITGVDPSVNGEMKEQTYIRTGRSSSKVSSQRSFSITGHRYFGDAFQDFCFSHKVKFGVGQACVAEYVFFNKYNGMGERGKVTISVNSDGGGNAGENATISIEMSATSEAPKEFDYSNQTA